MIVFDLECRVAGHRFEGWFGSSADFERQAHDGLLVCPVCGAADVAKAAMAPAVGRKGNQITATPPAPRHAPAAVPASMTNAIPALPPEAAAMLRAIAQVQAEAIKASTWVGDKFADQARAMHYGETDARMIHGQTTPDEARELLDEGVPVAPLLIPVIPPDKAN